ncbi:MAG: hypothetical protein ACO1PB_18045 [Ramlibacter sp.]
MKLCILGNSHASSLRRGWDLLAAAHPGHEPVFFASRGTGLGELEVSGDTLVPVTPKVAHDIAFTSGGLAAIRPDDYDAVLLYGLSLGVPDLDARLSEAVAHAACVDSVQGSTALRLARRIRAISARPIYLGPNPLLAWVEGPPRARKWSYDTVFERCAAAIDVPGVSLLRQPPATLHDEWTTRPEFLKDAMTLDVGDADSSRLYGGRRHMNAAFGRLWLEHFLGGPAVRR